MNSPSASGPALPRPVVPVLAGGLSAAVLDIVYACVLAVSRGRPPVRALQSVASGLVGASAYEGGAATAVLGLLLHTAILIVAAWLYSAVARDSEPMRRHFVACGALFGVMVFLFMNVIVVPLSAFPFNLVLTPASVAQGFVSHALLVGVPIAWCFHRFGTPRDPW